MNRQQLPRRLGSLGQAVDRAGMGVGRVGCAAVLATALSAAGAENAAVALAPAGRVESIRAELPNLLCPLSLIIDDGAPITEGRLSSEEVAKRRAEGKGADRWTTLEDFATLCAEFGVKGKFSVLSYLGSQGLVDTVTDPLVKTALDTYFGFVNTRLLPSFDITPEIISHGMVIDTETGQPLARQYTPQELAKMAVVDLHGAWRFNLGKSWPAPDVAGQKSKEPAGEDPGLAGHWENPALDDAGWSSVNLPGLWQEQGFAGKNGYGWFRKRFQVPAAAAQKKLYLVVMGIEHANSIYLNGELVGPEKSRRLDCFEVTTRLKADADNLIALRLADFDKRGGVTGCISLVEVEIQPALFNEAQWSQTQDEDTLERYIGRALTALKNAGVVANGVTSPWNFGALNEGNYARAVGRALKRVNGIGGGWYFLSTPHELYSEPRLMCFDWRNGEYVVSVMAVGPLVDMTLVSALGKDTARLAAAYITPDGQAGLLPEMIARRSYCVLCGHWGVLLNGGGEVYREVFGRLRQFYGDQTQWMTCSDIARYYAVSKTFRPVQRQDGSWLIETALPCPGFTVSFTATAPLRRLTVSGTVLKQDEGAGRRLEKGSWRQQGNTVYACFDLANNDTLRADFWP